MGYAGGFSPASFVYQVANRLPTELVRTSSIMLSISPEQPRVETKVDITLMNSTQTCILRNTLEVESECRLRDTYYEAEVAGQGVAVPEALRYERLLFITYVDEELMVVRDETGAPDILKRTSPPPVDEEVVAEPEIVEVVTEPEISSA